MPDGASLHHCEIREFRISDIESVRPLWAVSEGLGGPGDATESLTRFLKRNPGLSLVALFEGSIVGTALCGHDGRRGLIYRLAVADEFRRRGLAAELVARCLSNLRTEGIERCLALVHENNLGGREFWTKSGWKLRTDLVTYSFELTV